MFTNALNVERSKGLINENWVFTHIKKEVIMPVFINDEDTLQDYFERKIKENNYWIEPMILSEWIYGYDGNNLLRYTNPEVFTMIDEAKKITPNYEMADIITELFVVVNKIYNKLGGQDVSKNH